MKIFKILFLVMFAVVAAQASDLAKEARWKEQVVGDLFDGEPLDLNDGTVDFLGLLTEPEEANGKAVVVLHGVGVHPDWPQVINPLRVQLAEGGWTTLSIQLPILGNDVEEGAYEAIVPDAGPRIDAALAYLQELGIAEIYLVAHSLGARMTAYYLAQGSAPVKGFIGIGMNVGTVQYMDKISLPLLDLYGSDDLEGVRTSAGQRVVQASKNPAYSQVEVEGADHFFNGMDQELYDQVSGWLEAN